MEDAMFDIRKIQEKVIYESVKAESSAETANEVVYGKDQPAKTEDNPHWVKSAMGRMESRFDSETIKKIRMNCQCGYTMNEKLALVKELMSTAGNMEAFINSEKAKTPVFSTELGNFY